MTGNQFGMKGRNLQSHQIYLKAKEQKKELGPTAVMEVRRWVWPLLAQLELCPGVAQALGQQKPHS